METQNAMNQRALLDTLANLGGKMTADDDVTFSGTKFVLPETLTLQEAIIALDDQLRADEEMTAFSRVFNYRPHDVAHALFETMRDHFGIVKQNATRSFFGSNPPRLITVTTGYGQTAEVPWGEMSLPMLPGVTMTLDSAYTPNHGPVGAIYVTAPRKYRHHVQGLFKLVENKLATASIYRGKAFDGQTMPEFLNLATVDPSKVVYTAEVQRQLEANVWAMLRHTSAMRNAGISLKRAVLLEGPYGTGKTLAATLTAKIAVQNGWTFLYAKPGRDNMSEVMQTAKLYQPAVVFFEDIDTTADNGDAKHVSELLDTFDGIAGKGDAILAVLTTNHVERIHKGMLRPGRLDAVINIGALDRQGIETLIKSCVPDNMRSGALDYDAIADAMTDFLPAFVKEAVDRTVRYNIARNNGQTGKLTTDDFVAAANGLRPQLDLMNGNGEGTTADPLAVALANVVTEATEATVGTTYLQRTDDGGRGSHKLAVVKDRTV